VVLPEEATATTTELQENLSQEANTEAEVLPEEILEAGEASSEALEKPDPLTKTAATTENTDPSFPDTEEEVVANVATSEVVVVANSSLEANTEVGVTEVTSEEVEANTEAAANSFQEENIEEGANTGDAAEEAIQKSLTKVDTKSNRELEAAEEAIQKGFGFQRAMALPRTSELRAQRVQYLKLIW